VVVGMELMWLVDLARARLKRVKSRFLSAPAVVTHLLSLALLLCIPYAYFVEPYWPEVKQVDIATEKLSKTTLTIVQISDLHCDLRARNERKLAGLINPLKPDLVVFTGDALNDSAALPLFQETLKGLHAGIAKLAVRGNFDEWYWKDLPLFSGTGFTELGPRPMAFSKDGETFYVSGLEFSKTYDRRALQKGVPAGSYSVFLFHSPDLAEDFIGRKPDLYLAGHTHGGQIALPFYGAVITLARHGKKYEGGRYDLDGMTLYVNRGLGLEGGKAPRVRFLARPEITVFKIHPR